MSLGGNRTFLELVVPAAIGAFDRTFGADGEKYAWVRRFLIAVAADGGRRYIENFGIFKKSGHGDLEKNQPILIRGQGKRKPLPLSFQGMYIAIVKESDSVDNDARI